MEIKRRSFLGLLGMSPLAAKAAVDENIIKLTGLGTTPLVQGFDAAAYPNQVAKGNDVGISLARLKQFGLPSFYKDQIWESTDVHHLDPDIACKRSWSMNVKILTQKHRNFQKRINGPRKHLEFSVKQKAYEKLTGFWFWFY